MAKTEARTQALGALYTADVLGRDDVDTDGLSSRAARLASGTWGNRTEIDRIIDAASTRWRVDRMPAVDRTILRLATYELLYSETPTAVIISEAVELAKIYSTGRSGAFVNGVLSAIADAERQSTRV